MGGAFITIYGINNIGKSTHAKLLVEKLNQNGYEAFYLKYPIYDLEPTGPKINSILRSTEPQTLREEELQTLFAQNRRDFEPTLKSMLAAGKIVVAEDYTGTGIAWGMAKGVPRETMENINKDLLKEDFSILIVGWRALGAREKTHIHETNDALVDKVNRTLRELATDKKWHVVELQKEKPDTAALIWSEVKKFLESRA